MRRPFRLLVTGSRTWDNVRTIEQALAVILHSHPEGVLLVHGACPRGADAIAERTVGSERSGQPDHRPLGATLGATRANDLGRFRTDMNSRQECGRGHERI